MALIRPFAGIAPRFGNDVFVADTAVVLGDVEVGDEVSLWYGAVLRADVGKIRIGARSNIQDNACLHMSQNLSHALLGSDVIVGHGAIVHGAIIEDGCLIGMHSVILDNARIGAGAWVAAGSLVPADLVVPPLSLVRGSPARVVRQVRPEEQAWARDNIQRYIELARAHRREQLGAGAGLPGLR
jgi:carbonic anhydrase/acetyltransferase-like protein (isoleucine patch superfamily)